MERYPEGGKTFLIGSVRKATEGERERLYDFTEALEDRGVKVHLPERDTNQKASGFEICSQNRGAIEEADPLTILYNESSEGSHFDMGVGFANYKEIVPIGFRYNYGEFVGMLKMWEKEGPGQKIIEQERQIEDETKNKRVFIIAETNEYSAGSEIREVYEYVRKLEEEGVSVYFPMRDDRFILSKYLKCKIHREKMEQCDEAHIYYSPSNQLFFDMGLAFGNYIPIKVAKNVEYGPGKSYPRMIDEWASLSEEEV